MELLKDKDRRAGLIGTILFHIALLLIFMMVGLSQPNPLPEDEGAMIELGWTDTGSGDVESQVISPNEVVQQACKLSRAQSTNRGEDVLANLTHVIHRPKLQRCIILEHALKLIDSKFANRIRPRFAQWTRRLARTSPT